MFLPKVLHSSPVRTTTTSPQPLWLLHARHCTAAPSQCLFTSVFGCYGPRSFVLLAFILHLISCRAESASAAAAAAAVDLSRPAACSVYNSLNLSLRSRLILVLSAFPCMPAWISWKHLIWEPLTSFWDGLELIVYFVGGTKPCWDMVKTVAWYCSSTVLPCSTWFKARSTSPQ